MLCPVKPSSASSAAYLIVLTGLKGSIPALGFDLSSTPIIGSTWKYLALLPQLSYSIVSSGPTCKSFSAVSIGTFVAPNVDPSPAIVLLKPNVNKSPGLTSPTFSAP